MATAVKYLARLACVLGLFVALAFTLAPRNGRLMAVGNHAVETVRYHAGLPPATGETLVAATDGVGNVMLFIPFGFFGLLAFPGRARRVIVAGVAVSAMIELSQYLFLPHRSASASDVAADSIGTVIGVVAALVVSQMVVRVARLRTPRTPPRPTT